ncbi:MAG: 3-hydroxyacyl-CoA dehydrogenase NAD-binding domain-containing protein, partial [Pseudomonadota bacterium]|nr:3-hydroxyacyl-CoA dehydrogenase NAD-binding domain-containing protein [Pseudomonadota bacterium]
MTNRKEQITDRTWIAAVIGGGVIGGGWAARFLLNGWKVHIFDSDPDAAPKILDVLENARASLPLLSDTALPEEGQLVFCDTLEQAASGALWIQESVPERLLVKKKVFAALQNAADHNAIIASSTSGFTPTQLREGAAHPDQIIVAHPYNPVYLLPAVELVGGADNSYIQRAATLLAVLGMKPVILRAEIDAHIGDRLLEAVWREALWLVRDGIATTQDIDQIITHGFGLRWAQMGLFETYRMAGGEAGMRHFLAQFGPALAWPWTKLMDVPELDDALIDKIVSQSDEQSGHLSIQQLEQIRDRTLVGFLQLLKNH